jgi:hypothetical protein
VWRRWSGVLSASSLSSQQQQRPAICWAVKKWLKLSFAPVFRGVAIENRSVGGLRCHITNER